MFFRPLFVHLGRFFHFLIFVFLEFPTMHWLRLILLLSLSFQYHREHVRKQSGITHSSVGPQCAHSLHLQPAGDGRSGHHHHRLPWWTDLHLGHDPRAGGERSREVTHGLFFFKGPVHPKFTHLLLSYLPWAGMSWRIIIAPDCLMSFCVFRSILVLCCSDTRLLSPVCPRPAQEATNNTSSALPKAGERESLSWAF